MHHRPLLRALLRAAAVAAALVFASPARAQECQLPDRTVPRATGHICQMEPEVSLNPSGTLRTGQPSVPVSLRAEDHFAGNEFASFKIEVDGIDVTAQWDTVITVLYANTTEAKQIITATGTITLSQANPEVPVVVELCDTTYCRQATGIYSLALPGVRVTPDGQAGAVSPAASRITYFGVRNTGNAQATFALDAECRDRDGQRITPCGVTPASVTVAAGDSVRVTATYPGMPAGGSTNVLVRARQVDQPGVQDAGWLDALVTAGAAGTTPMPPGVVLVPLSDGGPTIERSQCITVATAPGGASECGNLRFVHPLPAHRTRGRTWVPTLLYPSQHAHPRPIVRADVTVPAGGAVPTSVELVVTMYDGTVHRASFAGGPFLPGYTRRVGVQWDALQTPTGLYPYTAQVISHYPAGPQASPAIAGEIAIVNYSKVYFGAGWWLSGMERLHCVQCASTSRLLLVQGDGSTRVYEPEFPNSHTFWVAQNPDGPPDTLVTTDSGYVRRLPGGGAVHFNWAGLHYKTVNRLGQTTRFTYNSLGLDAVYPPGSGPGTGGPAWTFIWDNPAYLVRGITATAPGTAPRTTHFTIDASGRLTTFTDPDSSTVAFAYATSPTRYIYRRRDRRGGYVYHSYTGLGKVQGSRVELGATGNGAVDPAQQLIHAESHGVVADGTTNGASGATPVVYTRIDGPRLDVNDHTYLYLTRTGAVRRVRDALGAETYVQHDARFPALATQVTSPTGQVTRAHYDARGRVDTMTVVSPLGDTRDHVTTYTYDDRWDAPTSTTSWERSGGTWTQLAGTARTAYDPQTGNVLWQQVGDDAARRTTFTYYASGAAAGQLASVRAPSGVPGQTARDSLVYDASGNLRMTVSPLGFLTLHERDALGRDSIVYTPVDSATSLTEASLRQYGARQSITYDRMDRPVRTVSWGPALDLGSRPGTNLLPADVGAEQLTVETTYDREGAPLEVRRWAEPDLAEIGMLVNRYTYDRAGRKLTESDSAQTQSFGYDLQGNQTWTTGRGHTVVTRHDVLGRVARRETPSVTYPSICRDMGLTELPPWEPEDPTFVGDPEVSSASAGEMSVSSSSTCEVFPRYPSRADGALVIPAEWTTFRYDGAGQMVHAENRDAVVQRSYYPGGALRTDTLRIRSYDGMDFTQHVYGIQHGYDAAGRPVSLQHPGNLAGTQSGEQYGYDDVTGAMSTLTDRVGNPFQFRYNHAGQMTSLLGPAYTDSTRYDLEGRRTWRLEYTSSPQAVLHEETFRYDARGKLITAGVPGQSDFHQWYSGLGNLVATDWDNLLNGGYMAEEFRVDALGNTVWRRTGGAGPRSYIPPYVTAYAPGTGRVFGVDRIAPETPTTADYPEREWRGFDLSGNMEEGLHRVWGPSSYGGATLTRQARTRSYYAADQKLRFFQESEILVNNGTPTLEGVWEEYRYDPLGRRVLVRSNADDLCNRSGTTSCRSHVTRSVWNGDQLLWELRASTIGTIGLESTGGSGAWSGRVSYTHGGGIDRPLAITRGDTTVIPHQNWRGQFSRGTYPNGASSDCVNSSQTNCSRIAWPGYRTAAWHEAKNVQAQSWWGGLVDGMRDASGQMYMRNRYYDPATGQFTQPDPIGLAGGLNSYGFAAGDPVSYSDPYGLKVCYEGSASDIRQLRETTERATNTQINLDEDNCIVSATPLANGRRGFRSLQRRLNNVIRSSRRIRVVYSSGHLSASAILGTVRVPSPGSAVYEIRYLTGQGLGCFGGRHLPPGVHSPESLMVHELLGHMEGPLWARTGLPPAERRANRVENEYHRAVGETPRCDWDTDRS